MKIKNVQYFTVIIGIFCLAVSIIAVLTGILRDSEDTRRLGITFAIIGLVLFCINMFAIMTDYINSRRIASGRPDFAYHALKRKTKKELEIFINYDDITTASGIKRDFLMRAKSYGVDPIVALDDYDDIVKLVENPKKR